jgi:hypothetical protein
MKAQPNVTPADCALAIAVPLAGEQFLEDLYNPSKDYANAIARANAGISHDYLWSGMYRPTAEFIERICTEVASLGVRVCRACSLEDFAELLSASRVVTLVAHWRFEDILPEDLLDVVAIARRLQWPDTELLCLVHEQIDGGILSQIFVSAAGGEDLLRKCVTSLLNGLIKPTRDYYETGLDQNVKVIDGIAVPPLRLTRTQLEEVFVNELATSRPIEFCDGLHSVGEFLDAIPPAYHGVIDLSVCNSSVLAASIKRRYRHCTVVSNKMAATPLLKLTRYRLVIHKLARGAEPFIDALIHVQAGA